MAEGSKLAGMAEGGWLAGIAEGGKEAGSAEVSGARPLITQVGLEAQQARIGLQHRHDSLHAPRR